MVVIRIFAGLGNQMFQYALYKLIQSMNKKVFADDYLIRKNGNAHYGLEIQDLFSAKYARIHPFFLSVVMKRPHNHAMLYNCVDGVLKKIGIEKIDHIHDRELSLQEIQDTDNRYYEGFWQKAELYSSIRDILLKEFDFSKRIIPDLNDDNRKMADRIKQSNSVSIHVRRGDYLKNADIFGGICTEDYYREAIKYISEKIDNPVFYMFSDDTEWVTDNFSFLDYTLVDINKGKNSHRDMYLMSICKHNIVANSTFSWWGAWLNTNKDKIVIRPKHFLNIDGGRDYIFPNEWVNLTY